MPYLKRENDRIFFEIYGSELDLSGPKVIKKPTIIVIHGGTGQLDHTYGIPFWQKASKFAQVIFIDNSGLGRSHIENNTMWSFEKWAHDIHYFCCELNIEKPFIAGDSTGGHIAMQFGIFYPQFAAGFILLDTEAKCDRIEIVSAFREHSETAATIAEKCLYAPTPEAVEQYMKICLPLCTQNPIPDNVYRYCNIVNDECLIFYNQKILYNFDLHDQLNTIKSPVLYLASAKNPYHNISSAIKTSKSFSRNIVDFHIFENSGLVQIDVPNEAMEKIKNFIMESNK